MQGKIGELTIVIGNATKDAEVKTVGEKKSLVASFGLAIGKRQDTTTIFANCKAWRHLATYASGIRKGDTVIVAGKFESREWEGKTYTDLTAEWLNVLPKIAMQDPFTQIADKADEFDDSDSGQLPF